MDELTPTTLAEAVERARYELLRHGSWDDLRDAERATRIGMLRDALDASGVAAMLERLTETARRVDAATGLLAQRDAEISRRSAEHDAEVAALAARIAALEAELAQTSTALTAATARAEGAEAALRASAVAADAVDPDDDSPADRDATTDAAPAMVLTVDADAIGDGGEVVTRGRLARLARVGHR